MSQFNPGDVVSLLPPFDSFFPDQYTVEGWDESGNALIEGGRGFSDNFFSLVTRGSLEVPPVIPVPITRYAFQNRFTLAELITIEMASLDNPVSDPSLRQLAAVLRVQQRKLDLAKFIDLTDPLTIAGVKQLESFGLIGVGRSDIILSTTISANEAA